MGLTLAAFYLVNRKRQARHDTDGKTLIESKAWKTPGESGTGKLPHSTGLLYPLPGAVCLIDPEVISKMEAMQLAPCN